MTVSMQAAGEPLENAHETPLEQRYDGDVHDQMDCLTDVSTARLVASALCLSVLLWLAILAVL